MIKLAHVKKSHVGFVAPIKVYCGRGWKGRLASPLKNKYRPADFGGQPGSTLPAYKKWLWGKLQKQSSIQSKLLVRLAKLHNDNRRIVLLQCHCEDTSTCHCTVIKKFIEWLAEGNKPKSWS